MGVDVAQILLPAYFRVSSRHRRRTEEQLAWRGMKQMGEML
jgi:hypothetical protein